MNTQRSLATTIAVSALTALAVILAAIGIIIAERPRITAFLLGTSAAPQTTSVGGSAVTAVVKRANPAVVSIIITKDVPIVERYYSPPLFDFFGNLFDLPAPQYRENGTRKAQVGGGSGFFVAPDGLIITNKHVVDDPAAEYTVYTNDGKKHKATVVAEDPLQDIAFLRIASVAGASYPYLAFGDSKKLELGQTVIAIGNALSEFRNTVSVGVVSGLARSIVAGDVSGNATEQLDQVIQTDAAINPGNSGGPLLDLSGNVIGVNVAVAAGSQNIGFALPASAVSAAVESVKAKGSVIRPYLGIRYVPVTENLKEEKKLSVDYGVLVTAGQNAGEPAVIPNSPAAKAGLVENDIILEFNGAKITPDATLTSQMSGKKVGDEVSLKVLRAGAEKIITLTLEAYRPK